MNPELSRFVIPPGGFVFDQLLNDGSSARITGGSLDQIQELILRYRQVNGPAIAKESEVTPEAVWADFHAQICAKYPWLCTSQREPLPVTVDPSGASGFEMLLQRMQRWLDLVRTSAISWVDTKTASDRANVCLGCPQNLLWMTNCGTCNQNITQLSAALRGARRLAQDQALKGCRAFGTLQEVAVWMQEPGGDNKYPAPPICWRLFPHS